MPDKHRFIETSVSSVDYQDSEGRPVKARKLRVLSYFPAKPEMIWQQLKNTNSLQHICKPLLHFKSRNGYTFKEHWQQGDTAYLSLWAFGVLPLGRHDIHLATINTANMQIQSREKGAVVKVWDHLITLEAHGSGTLYLDEVILYAGWLTVPVVLWARFFYIHRQRRWQQLIRNTV